MKPRRRPRRPRSKTRRKTPAGSHDSIRAAAAALGVPASTLRWAKRQGAPGFRGSRVYGPEVLAWLAKQDVSGLPMDRDGLECRRLQQRIERDAWEFEREKGDWIRRAEVEGFFLEVGERIKALLRAKLKNELPPKLEGLRAPEIAARMDPIIAELVHLWRYGGQAAAAAPPASD